MIPLVDRASRHDDRLALVAPAGKFRYRDLLDASARVADRLLQASELQACETDTDKATEDLGEEPVAYLVPPGFSHVAVQWGIWRAGGIAVPLATMYPPPELAYVLEDTGARTVVAAGDLDPDLDARLRMLAEERGLRVLTAPSILATGGETGGSSRAGGLPAVLPDVPADRGALMVYTSGTTGRPKGVVTTHRNLEAQITALVEAWRWRPDDRVLHVLPLHHVHGIVNVLCCALWSGAVCEMMSGFEAEEVWQRFALPDEEERISLFMAVPTIYARLLAAWDGAPPAQQRAWSEGAARLRLTVSGSAALPVSRLERWREVTGQVLLERYGMTEIGMALSNPLEGERRPGTVGRPLPGVEVRRVDDRGRELGPEEDDAPGELEIRGPAVFREYWKRPKATCEAFRDGWFGTGDVAVVEEGGYFRLLGRKGVDIVKTGGFKVSALEIEEVLRGHPAVEECAVVGVPDPEWGERVAAAVVVAEGVDPGLVTLDPIREWCKERLASYKAPTLLEVVEALPRNALGKVTKPALVAVFRS